MSLLSKAVKSVVSNPGNVIKKAIQVNVAGAVGVVSGFATGGVPGAIAGGVVSGGNALQAVSKEGKTSNTRLLKESIGFGAAAGGVTGVARALAPGVGTPGGLGSVSKALEGAGKSKFGVVGSVLGAVGKYTAAGVPALAALFKTGTVPGTDETPSSIAETTDNLYNKVRSGYTKVTGKTAPDVGNITDTIRDKAVGAAKNRGVKFFGSTNDNGGSTGTPVIVNAPAPGQVSEGMNPAILLAGAGLLALMFLKKN